MTDEDLPMALERVAAWASDRWQVATRTPWQVARALLPTLLPALLPAVPGLIPARSLALK
jgi:hypothetical protein